MFTFIKTKILIIHKQLGEFLKRAGIKMLSWMGGWAKANPSPKTHIIQI